MYINAEISAIFFDFDISYMKLYIVIPDKNTVINVNIFNAIIDEFVMYDINNGIYVVNGP